MKKTLILAAVAAFVMAAPAAFAEEGHSKHRNKGGWMFKAADKNDDGSVSREEFREFQSKIFDKMDANGDGVVTHDEAKAKMAERREKMMERLEKHRQDHEKDSGE